MFTTKVPKSGCRQFQLQLVPACDFDTATGNFKIIDSYSSGALLLAFQVPNHAGSSLASFE